MLTAMLVALALLFVFAFGLLAFKGAYVRHQIAACERRRDEKAKNGLHSY